MHHQEAPYFRGIDLTETGKRGSAPKSETRNAKTVVRGRQMVNRHIHRGRYGKRKRMIVDSGCTFHLHNDANDLINIRVCTDTISGLSDSSVSCTVMGDIACQLPSRQTMARCTIY
jgi:hypothetical protein